MHFLEEGLGLKATDAQLAEIQWLVSPDAMRNGDNGTYVVMDKNPDNPVRYLQARAVCAPCVCVLLLFSQLLAIMVSSPRIVVRVA